MAARETLGGSGEDVFARLGELARQPGAALAEGLRRAAQGAAEERTAGHSSDSIFPVPYLPERVPRRGRGRERALRRQRPFSLCNAVLGLLNFMYVGRWGSACTLLTPTTAQRRLQDCPLDRLTGFLRGLEQAGGEAEIESYLREGPGYQSWGVHNILPLGERAGVPEEACTASLAEVLHGNPEVLATVREPRRLLLPPARRPARVKRPFTRLADSYHTHVVRCQRAGLQRLVKKSHVYKFKGRPLLSGAFSVPKDELEDRCISALVPSTSSWTLRACRR